MEWACGQFAAGGSPTRSEHQRRSQRAASREHDLRSTARGPRTQSGPAPSTDAGSSTANTVVLNMASARCAKRAQVAAAARASDHTLQPSTPGNRWVPPRGSGRRRRPQARSVLRALHLKWLPLWNLGQRVANSSHWTEALPYGSSRRASWQQGSCCIVQAPTREPLHRARSALSTEASGLELRRTNKPVGELRRPTSTS